MDKFLLKVNLMKRCPAQDPGRKACIEHELPEAINAAYLTVGSPGQKEDPQEVESP